MTLVFVHGSGGNGAVWRYQTNYFEDSVALTLPGRPDGELCDSIESAAAWTWSELQADDIEQPVIVGHSLGGAIALQLALEHPGDLSGIVLIGSGARLRVHPATLAALEEFVAGGHGFEAMFEDAYDLMAPDFAEDLARERNRIGPKPFLGDMLACDRFDVTERLGEINTPTLAIVGTEDVMTPPKYSNFLRDRMPNARVEIVNGGTHLVYAEFPEQVNAAIEGFTTAL